MGIDVVQRRAELKNAEQRALERHRTLGERAKQAALFPFFWAMLLIPRLRRLRRRVWTWSFVRLGVAACATWLGWSYTNAGAGKAALILSLLLFAFSLLVRAKPQEKSIDDLAHELNALIVLNGGLCCPAPQAVPVPAHIVVRPDQLIVVGPRERRIMEIPLAAVRNLAAHPVSNGEGASPWEVEVNWADGEPHSTTFQYEGAFAEHLARVTESTLRSQWKKELPVIPA
jgi:hypothetical protein